MRDHPLPDAAKAKLAGIEGARIDAAELMASCSRRLNSGGGNELEMARLAAMREREHQRQEELSGFVWRAREWLNALAPSVTLEMAPPVAAELKEGETFQQAVKRVREEVAALSLELITAKNAPPPKQDVMAAMRQHVMERRARGRPAQIALDRGQFHLRWPEIDAFAPLEGLLNFAAWLNPDGLIAAFETEIDAAGEPKGALGALEKAKVVSELETRLDLLERQEEALVVAGGQQGFLIERRGNAGVAPVLGVVIAAEARTQAA